MHVIQMDASLRVKCFNLPHPLRPSACAALHMLDQGMPMQQLSLCSSCTILRHAFTDQC